MLNNVRYDLLRGILDFAWSNLGKSLSVSISIISVLKGIGTGHLPIQCRSVTSCASPLGSKYLLLGNNTAGTTNNSLQASGRKTKTEKSAGGESIRGHGSSPSMGVLCRASVYLDFIFFGHKRFWHPKTASYNKFISF